MFKLTLRTACEMEYDNACAVEFKFNSACF